MLYPLDETKVEQLLQYIEQYEPTLSTMVEAGPSPLVHDIIRRLAAERLVQLLTEAITDVLGLIIDGLMLRDPGSYQDMVEIVTQEGAFPPDYGKQLEKLVGFRNRLVRDYVSVTVDELAETLKLAGQLVPAFAGYIRAFLEEELFRA